MNSWYDADTRFVYTPVRDDKVVDKVVDFYGSVSSS